MSYVVYTSMSYNIVWWKTMHCAKSHRLQGENSKWAFLVHASISPDSLPLPKDSASFPDEDVHSTSEEEPNDFKAAVHCWSRSVYFTVKFMVLTCRSMQSTRFCKRDSGESICYDFVLLWSNDLYFVTIKNHNCGTWMPPRFSVYVSDQNWRICFHHSTLRYF